MMYRHAAAPSEATGQTNGTRNGRGRSGWRDSQHQHADADDREREERPDVRQVVDLVLVATRLPTATTTPVTTVVTCGVR